MGDEDRTEHSTQAERGEGMAMRRGKENYEYCCRDTNHTEAQTANNLCTAWEPI